MTAEKKTIWFSRNLQESLRLDKVSEKARGVF